MPACAGQRESVRREGGSGESGEVLSPRLDVDNNVEGLGELRHRLVGALCAVRAVLGGLQRSAQADTLARRGTVAAKAEGGDGKEKPVASVARGGRGRCAP